MKDYKKDQYKITDVASALKIIGVTTDTKATFKSYKPRDFQIDGAKDFAAKNNFGLYDETGVGKTYTIFLSALAWHFMGNKVIIMTKPGLFRQLQEEWDSLFEGLDIKPETTIGADILLMSHASIYIPRYRRAIMAEYFVFIIDEFHKMRNAEGRRFKTLMAYRDRDELAIMPVTATPATKDIRDCFSVIEITSPGVYRDYWAFCNMHVIYHQWEGKRLVKGFKNEKRVGEVLRNNSRRLLKQDVWKGLATPLRSTRYLTLTESQAPIYEDFQEFLIFENEAGDLFDASYTPTLKFAKGIQAITYPSRFEAGAVSCVLEDVKSIADTVVSEGNRLLVFVLYEETAMHFLSQLKEYNPACITGNLKEDVKFKTDPSCGVCVATLGAGAEGYSFQKVCSHIYLAEYLPVPGWIEQAQNRIYRPGQIAAPTLYVPHVKDTLYVSSLQTKLEQRQNSINKLY